MQRFLILFLLTTACLGAQGQQLAPNDYIYPLRELKQRLYSANFGEIRPGHFHAGVDIKTDAEEGKPVVAAADGYVSRVVLQAGGYGRAVYLTLRNGTTVVYGHLRRFRDDIERHVRRERYERRSNGVNLWFGPGTWPVKQGDVVAYSGDSGSSGGPHLHYEIRDTETQRLYNPVREGIIRPRDEYPPRIVRLHYVEVDTVQGVPVRSVPESYAVVRTAAGRYALTHDGPVGVGRRGYFVAEVTDRRNDVWNSFGVWRVTAFADGIPCFEFRMDSFTYDISRCSDAVSCYPIQINSRNEAIRLAQLEGAPDSFYPTMAERGLIRTRRGSLACVGGAYADGAVTASVRTAGDLAIVADTLPPAIRPLFAEGADLTRAEGVRFRAADNFSGIASWRLHIDGKWVPCDRFPMKGTLVHFFDAPAQRRTHAVRLSVTDGCGNATHFEGTFYR